MIKLKTVNSTELLERQLENKNFKKEYNSLEAEFSIAKEIIHLRKNAHLTQTQLAKKAHTSRSAIAKIEYGEYQNVSLKFLKKIGAVFGVSPEVHFKKIK